MYIYIYARPFHTLHTNARPNSTSVWIKRFECRNKYSFRASFGTTDTVYHQMTKYAACLISRLPTL